MQFFRLNQTKVACITSKNLVPYQEALDFMSERVDMIINGTANPLIWLLEHVPIYTAGAMTLSEDLISPKIPVISTNRGGRCTYHGPGQRMLYIMLDLGDMYYEKPDIKDFILRISQLLINILKNIGVIAFCSAQGTGVWIRNKNVEEKICSIGVKVKKWVTSHGVAVNISPDLTKFDDIIPCGIQNCRMTSLEKLGKNITISEFDSIIIKEFKNLFNCECYYEESFI